MKNILYILLIGISTLISCSGSPDPLYPRYTTFLVIKVGNRTPLNKYWPMPLKENPFTEMIC